MRSPFTNYGRMSKLANYGRLVMSLLTFKAGNKVLISN
jgi:hypothetical protein